MYEWKRAFLSPSRTPPHPPRPPAVSHLCLALKRATLLKTRFRSLSTDGVHSPVLRSLTVQWGEGGGRKPEAWALKALGPQDRRARAPPPPL